MKCGILYGIGVGPGDPELMTVRAVNILSRCRHVFVPRAEIASESLSFEIAKNHIPPDAHIHEVTFPVTTDSSELTRCWDGVAVEMMEVLGTGEDACFITLGDPLLFSTYIHLLVALKRQNREVKVVTIPGITAFSASAALTAFPVGRAKEPVTIVPTAEDLDGVRQALERGGTVVLMKIGRRLPELLHLLEGKGLIDRAVFVARAGLEGQHIETDLRRLSREPSESGNLSIILVQASEERAE
jgi:precorrin-2/cobalt-factor-2 C20-methyltransferase